jgi:hypothetical protein
VVPGFATQTTHATNATQQWGITAPVGVAVGGAGNAADLFRPLRKHNLHTREAWTAIPASEGARILDLVSPSLSFIHKFPFPFGAENSELRKRN